MAGNRMADRGFRRLGFAGRSPHPPGSTHGPCRARCRRELGPGLRSFSCGVRLCPDDFRRSGRFRWEQAGFPGRLLRPVLHDRRPSAGEPPGRSAFRRGDPPRHSGGSLGADSRENPAATTFIRRCVKALRTERSAPSGDFGRQADNATRTSTITRGLRVRCVMPRFPGHG